MTILSESVSHIREARFTSPIRSDWDNLRIARIPLPFGSFIETLVSDQVRWVVFSEPGFSADSHMTIRPFLGTWVIGKPPVPEVPPAEQVILLVYQGDSKGLMEMLDQFEVWVALIAASETMTYSYDLPSILNLILSLSMVNAIVVLTGTKALSEGFCCRM